MPLPEALKAERARNRMLETAKKFTTGTYIRQYVAPLFQRVVRAEWGSDPRRYLTAVVAGEIRQVERKVGQCVCITCGKIEAWESGLGGMHTGHFLASRCNSIIFEEANVAPQCSRCNVYASGSPQQFRLWMEMVRGTAEIERLQKLKGESKQFSREELVDMRIAFQKRLDAAIERMTT